MAKEADTWARYRREADGTYTVLKGGERLAKKLNLTAAAERVRFENKNAHPRAYVGRSGADAA